VERALLAFDAGHQRVHLLGPQMVAPDRDPAAACLVHQGRGLLDRLRPVQLRTLGSARSPGDVHGRSRRAQVHGYPPARSPGGSGDQRDLACQRRLHATDLLV
jgi:hypothetical protein